MNKETKNAPDQEQQTSQKDDSKQEKSSSMADILQNKQHKELLFYLSVAIFFLELIVGGVAFFYGIIHATPGVDGGPPQFQFPWLAYGIGAVVAPTALLFIVHLAGVGLFKSMHKKSAEEEAAWQENLPVRLRKVYIIIKGAPALVLFLSVMLVGVALFYMDGAIGVLLHMGQMLAPYWPWIIGGGLAALCIIYLGKAYFTYRTRRMEHEYAYRLEIFERTGHIIVDKGSMPLPPAYDISDSTRPALAENIVEALPTAQVSHAETHEATQDDVVVEVISEKENKL